MKKQVIISICLAHIGAAALAASTGALRVRQNEVAEWRGQSSRTHADPFNEITLDALVTLADGSEQCVPAFWAGKREWRFRFSSAVTGRFPFRTICSDSNNTGLHDRSGVIEVTPYRGKSLLLRHGPVHLSADRRYFAHADGTPFFWLADSWWHGMTARLTMDGFKMLVADPRSERIQCNPVRRGLSL